MNLENFAEPVIVRTCFSGKGMVVERKQLHVTSFLAPNRTVEPESTCTYQARRRHTDGIRKAENSPFLEFFEFFIHLFDGSGVCSSFCYSRKL